MPPNFSKYKLGHVTLKSLEHLYVVQTSPFPHSIQNMNQRASVCNKLLKMTTTDISPICMYPQAPFLLAKLCLLLCSLLLNSDYAHALQALVKRQEILVINNISSTDIYWKIRESLLLEKNRLLCYIKNMKQVHQYWLKKLWWTEEFCTSVSILEECTQIPFYLLTGSTGGQIVQHLLSASPATDPLL